MIRTISITSIKCTSRLTRSRQTQKWEICIPPLGHFRIDRTSARELINYSGWVEISRVTDMWGKTVVQWTEQK